MVPSDSDGRGLPPAQATRLIRSLLAGGAALDVTPHARRRMAQRRVTMVDVHGVLRSGAVVAAELRAGGWRYSVSGRDQAGRPLTVVVAIQAPVALLTVTVIRR